MKGLLLLLASLLLATGDLRLEWRTALELDAAAEVVRSAEQAFAADERLQRDGELLALYARALSQTGGAQQARNLLEEAGGQVNADTRASIELALARLDLEEDKLGAVISRLATEDKGAAVRFPERPEAWLLCGKALARRGETKRSAELLRHFVQTWRLHREAPAAWHLLAQEALGRRDLEAAKSYRDRGQELSTWHGYYKTRRLQVRANPRAPLPRLGLAQLWISVGELERAREALEELVRLCPDFARGWALLGEVQRKSGQAGEAFEAFGKALTLDANLHAARFNRALLALLRGEDSTARADFEALTRGTTAKEPRYLAAHLHLARILRRAGESEAAATRYAKYLELGGSEQL